MIYTRQGGVETCHPQYHSNYHRWKLVRDCVQGEDVIKRAGAEYLPKSAGWCDDRYNAYKTRAQWVNYVEQTLNGVHGMIFRRQPAISVPDGMEDIIANIDMQGNSIAQFLSNATHDLLQTCWGGFLADMPSAENVHSKYDEEQAGIRPYAVYYPAESLINWKFKTIKGQKKLSLVVLKENIELNKDEFSHETTTQYRVLDLDEQGFYRQRLFTRVFNDITRQEEEVVIDEVPVIVKGKRLDYIPFVLLVADEPTKSPLLDLAYVNVGHYRKSADYENAVHLTCIGTGYATGHTQKTDENGDPEPIFLGQDEFIILEETDSRMGVLEFAGSGINHMETAIEQSERQMIVLGSRIITPEKNVSETAEAALIHRAGENAKLATFARNISEKATRLLEILRDWNGNDGYVSIQLNTDYDTRTFDANIINSIANLFSYGKLPLICVYSMLMKGEILDPDMRYEDYVRLLDLEESGLSDVEVYEAYKKLRTEGVFVGAKNNAREHKKDEKNDVPLKTKENPRDRLNNKEDKENSDV